ncbi:MAG: hypothetical protein FWG50_04175 [Kiritimatiellaeota bacterium]|nr:hypothetical protein [Kiritimatiellota bacterium]
MKMSWQWFGVAAAVSLSVSGAEPVWHSGLLKEATAGPRAVTDKALALSGTYKLQMDSSCLPEAMKQFSVSAWVKPEKFDMYNEIFRVESGKGRVLFSFQERGYVLALGLDVNGRYLECDAPIRPEAVTDGAWHFAAATFDGQTMRVYLDGMLIESLPHRGTAAVARAPGFVGSMNGTGEFFQGAIDDLRLYTECLPPETLAVQMKDGAAQLAARGAKPKLDAWKHSMDTRLQMATEYMPVTEAQWDRCLPAERAKWKEIKAQVEKIKTMLAGDVAAAGQELLDALSALAAAAPERPVVRERVAPYIPPATLATRTYTRDEARRAIEGDWLFQVAGKPDLKRELERTRKVAERLGADAPELAKLAAAAAAPSLSEAAAAELYLAIRRARRDLMLKDPAVDFSRLLLVDMPYPQGSEWNHETRHRLGYMAVPGGQLLVVDGLSLDGAVRRLMPQDPLHGSFWRPDLSFDGTRVLFCFKPHNEKAFHIYEIGLDGKGLRQLTSGIFDDFDPVYLPDGTHYVFSSTRGHTYVRCMPPTNAYMLMRGALDGNEVFFISANNEPEYLPSVMNDGRIIYTRWEYTDKPLWRCQSIWTANPDGTQHNTFWGNQSVWPDLLKDARAIPGSRRVMFTGSAHHNWFAGCIGIIDPDKGANFPYGLTKVTQELSWPECGNGPMDPAESADYLPYGKYESYQTPYPLSEKLFLVSAHRNGKYALYLMDTDGNRELIYEGANHILHAMPVRPRPVPTVVPDRVEWPTRADRDNPAGGTIYSADIYAGAPEEIRDRVKFLRVLHIEQKTYTYWDHRPALSTGPVVSLVQSDGVKRILGTVPVHPDGSCWFKVPAGVALHFQLLDADHRALHTMRSFANVQPGESRGCLGCHEQHSRAPQPKFISQALRAPPSAITPVPWALGADPAPAWAAYVQRFGTSVGYVKDVQPVLDRYCGGCHQGDGKARKVLDLTLRGYEPYATLVGHPGWGSYKAPPKDPPPGYDLAGIMKIENFDQRDPKAYATTPPLERLSCASPLVARAASGKHHDVKVDPDSLMRLILWVDTLGPYRSDDEIRAEDDPVFQGSEWIAIKPRLKTAPIVVRPGPFPADSHSIADWPNAETVRQPPSKPNGAVTRK